MMKICLILILAISFAKVHSLPVLHEIKAHESPLLQKLAQSNKVVNAEATIDAAENRRIQLVWDDLKLFTNAILYLSGYQPMIVDPHPALRSIIAVPTGCPKGSYLANSGRCLESM